jgi:3-methylcrotonyl-CoA carboxylase alpha subunit
MIKKILIANRGEIALRVIKTCKRIGIKTVTIYAQDDSSLPHAFESDESFNLGSGELSSTYLNQDKIIQIAKDTNSDAIHPGYGFLSENTDFCKKVKEAGIIFIGPSVEAIELMGDKTTSKVKMEKINIPLIPGYHGTDQDPKVLLGEAQKIGFPVLIKATAGGGGKGMRIVNSEEEFTDALNSSKREALNAFSNDNVLLEKYITNPRHIEVQLVSDGKGNHFHFFERECSIQRRYQKVIEESPSPALTEKLRESICKTAVEIARGIDYRGAGTIEYILAPNNEFYFLEMNTRLQVEHPVTEMVTGHDLVELQIIAASGEAFDFKQEDITQTGHSFECRIYAEDPDNEFLPTAGRIQKIQADTSVDYRLDCGYIDGNKISTNYDPMLAKLVVHDLDRYSAIDKMQDALNDILFGGTKTNRDYLKRVLNHDSFIEGNFHTHFIELEKEQLKSIVFNNDEKATFIAGALIFDTLDVRNIWDKQFKAISKQIVIDQQEISFELTYLNRNQVSFILEGDTYRFTTLLWEPGNIVLEYQGQMIKLSSFPINLFGDKQIFAGDYEAVVKIVPKAARKTGVKTLSEGSLQSPMPGKIFKILLGSGDVVKTGDPVLIVEAMKMEHMIRAPKDGTIKEIFFKEGEQVQGGVLLCEIE